MWRTRSSRSATTTAVASPTPTCAPTLAGRAACTATRHPISAIPTRNIISARLLLDSSGPLRDPRQAARWLHAAANKGQYQAQAVLGRLLFKGENGPRQAARGLMWLALASSNAGPADAWIVELYEAASKQATDDERVIAGDMLVKWMNGRRD